MQFVVFTGQHGIYKGPKQLDITVRTTDPIGRLFAPTWEIVRPIINSRKYGLHINTTWKDLENTYTAQYEALLLQKIGPAERQQIAELFQRDPFVVLMCYCKRHDFCHRNLVAQWFVRAGAHLGTMYGWIE
ncbi:MAG: DUF488 family protein [Desulfobacteraceae bacterium]|nr:DUF488 family protein [Desulfobacteraceae bacterium]